MRVVFWNILAGGGKRSDAIARAIRGWRPDVAVLCEFRATPPSRSLAGNLAECDSYCCGTACIVLKASLRVNDPGF